MIHVRAEVERNTNIAAERINNVFCSGVFLPDLLPCYLPVCGQMECDFFTVLADLRWILYLLWCGAEAAPKRSRMDGSGCLDSVLAGSDLSLDPDAGFSKTKICRTAAVSYRAWSQSGRDQNYELFKTQT